MKVYRLKIVFDDDKEEIEYIQEEITGDERDVIYERGSIDLGGYFDEEGLELIAGCYIVGEA